ncbi:MAG TPA: DUF2325 domain-containing protein, partial [Polyangiaceae bacterium]|nr:DUF2325 domain-containing protein [Polyangiaceae bacterium]
NDGFYAELAERAGYRFEHHSGHMAGRGTSSLDALVERCDVVIVVTDVNSHAAVWRVRRLCKQRASRCLLMSRCGPSKFSALLEQFSQEAESALRRERPARAEIEAQSRA